MATSFRSVSLDPDYGDAGAMLVFREERLAAVISCLGEQHGEIAGRWYVEALFSDFSRPVHQSFATLEEFERWLSDTLG